MSNQNSDQRMTEAQFRTFLERQAREFGEAHLSNEDIESLVQMYCKEGLSIDECVERIAMETLIPRGATIH